MTNEPTPSELVRLIERNHADNREIIAELKTQLGSLPQQFAVQMREYVLRDVYNAEIKALQAEVKEARDDNRELKEEVTLARRGNRSAMIAAVFSFLGAVAFLAFQTLLKGGH